MFRFGWCRRYFVSHYGVLQNEKSAAMFRKVNTSYEALLPLSMCITEEERNFEEVKQNKAKEDIFAVYDKCNHCGGMGTVIKQRTD